MRYLIKALPIKETFIPFWELPTKDFRDEGEEEEDIRFHYPGNEYRRVHEDELKEVYYDPHTKKMDYGIVVNLYLDIEYQVGESILYEVEHHLLSETTVTGIDWEFQFQTAMFGKAAREYYGKDLPDYKWDDTKLYNLITWKPRYNIKDLNDSIWDYRIFRKK